MAVGYNLFKTNDAYTLEVLADCTVKFYYKNNGTYSLLKTEELLTEEAIDLVTAKDGEYKIVLIEPITLEETVIEFRVTSHLEKSIASDAYYILVEDDYDCGCKVRKETCTGRQDRRVLKSREIFVKLFTYHLKYLPSISFNANLAFNNYVTKAIEASSCKVQTKVNKILIDECNGNHASSGDLFKLYLAIYWAGLYFTAKTGVVDEDELKYIDTKYYYAYISAALCDLCVTIEELENIYNNN